MAKSVGSLYVDIFAKVDTLEKDMGKVKRIVGETEDSMRKSGASAKAAFESFSLFNSFKGRGLTGIVSDVTALMLAFNAVKNEIKFVYENIDKIPGIAPEAVASVNELKTNLYEMQNFTHRITANVMNFVLQFGKALGVTAASMMPGAGGLANTVVPVELEALDKLRRAQDPQFDDKVRQALVRLSEARKADAVAAMVQADRVVELRKQAEQYEKFAKSNSIDTLQRTEAETKAYQKRKEANLLEVDILNKYNTAKQREQQENQRTLLSEMTQLERIRRLREMVAAERAKLEIPTTNLDLTKGGLTTKEMEKYLQVAPDLVAWTKALREELTRVKDPAEEFRDALIGAFSQVDGYLTSFITGGEAKLSDFLKNMADTIISTFLKLAVINPIINGIFGGGVGGALLPALYGAGANKRASGGPGGGLTWVGENGPELVNLPAGSYVNDAQRSRESKSDKPGNTYIIDARGADMAAAARIESLLLSLAGPGIVERRALAAVTDSKWRRGGA